MPQQPKTQHKSFGFTLIEVMIVVAIIGLLSVLGLMSWRNQIAKSKDALIKSDLDRLKIAFEDYYNDNNCYPPETWFDGTEDCNSNHLAPYLSKIPCHPKTNLPYVLEKDSTTGCSWFKLFGNLTNTSDPNSFSTIYNGGAEPVTYNYAVSSSNVRLITPPPPPSPTPTPPPGNFACTPSGECDTYANPIASGCRITFAIQTTCTTYCPSSTPAERCNK